MQELVIAPDAALAASGPVKVAGDPVSVTLLCPFAREQLFVKEERRRGARRARRRRRTRLGSFGRMQIGDPAPAFELTDTAGRPHALPGDGAAATVVYVMCNHCPYVVAWIPRMRAVAEDYADRGVRFLAINGNDAERYPADAPERMRAFVDDSGWPVPYLFDESQDVLRSLDAERTPEVYVFDGEGALAYHGAPDGDHDDPAQGGQWLRDALDAILVGTTPDPAETPARGCSVKWR